MEEAVNIIESTPKKPAARIKPPPAVKTPSTAAKKPSTAAKKPVDGVEKNPVDDGEKPTGKATPTPKKPSGVNSKTPSRGNVTPAGSR